MHDRGSKEERCAAYSLVSGLFLTLLTCVQLLRIFLRWPVRVAGIDVPLWVSGIAAAIVGSLAFWRFGRVHVEITPPPPNGLSKRRTKRATCVQVPRLKGSGGKRAVALLALKRSGIALTRDVVSIANADEELLGTRGATVFVERHPELLRDIEKIVPRSGPSIAALGSIVGL